MYRNILDLNFMGLLISSPKQSNNKKNITTKQVSIHTNNILTCYYVSKFIPIGLVLRGGGGGRVDCAKNRLDRI